jgi:hypothetical protein
METICFCETSVDFQRTTWRYTLKDSTLHNHRCENTKSYIVIISVHTVAFWAVMPCSLVDRCERFGSMCYLQRAGHKIEDTVPLLNSGIVKKKKRKMSLGLTNYVLCHGGVRGRGCIDPHFLDLGTSWR